MGLNRKAKPIYVTEDTRLKFGKHKGTKVKEVLDFDPGWLDGIYRRNPDRFTCVNCQGLGCGRSDSSDYDYDIGDMPY